MRSMIVSIARATMPLRPRHQSSRAVRSGLSLEWVWCMEPVRCALAFCPPSYRKRFTCTFTPLACLLTTTPPSDVSDEVRLGTSIFKAKHLGLAATSNHITNGIFGAGRSALGASPSLIEQMVAQGVLSSYAFSLDLGPRNDSRPG